jgi:hypothetical protein
MASSEQPQGAKEAEAPRKCYQELCVDAIVAGDLAAFKKLCVNKHAINQPLLACQRIEVKAALSKFPYPVSIRGPTMLMLAIECEQCDIITYILETRRPELSTKSPDGYNCIHVAAMVADPHPLELLLRYRWVQEHIEDELVLAGQTARQGCKNTSLTIAVSFGNLAQVFLLLSEFPRPVDAEPDSPQFASGNVDQASAHGSPPLYMAIFKKNAKLVQVLLAANADATALGPKNESCTDLAHRLKREQDAAIQKRKERMERENKPFVQPPESDIDRIVKFLDETPNSDFDELKRKFCPELVPAVQLPPEEPDEPSRIEECSAGREGSGAPQSQTGGTGGRAVEQVLENILRVVQGIEGRLMAVERAVEMGGVVRQVRTTQQGQPIAVCTSCAGPNARPCADCQKLYCDACRAKPTHTCL